MNETRQLVAAIDEALAARRRVALATVVAVEGSAYRREGAKLLVLDGGDTIGLISGGCLEGEVGQAAARVLAGGAPERRRYDLRDDVLFGLGSGCGGIVEVLIEPLEPLEPEAPLDAWLAAVRAERPVARALVTRVAEGAGGNVVETEADVASDRRFGTQLVLVAGEAGDERIAATALGDALGDEVVAALEALLAAGHDSDRGGVRTMVVRGSGGEQLELLCEATVPPPRLVIFGAGIDAVPVAALAERAGFAVTVVDPRAAFLTEAAFPRAQRLRVHPGSYAEAVPLGRNDLVLLMNHHFERDAAGLRYALSAGVGYLGVLGPRERFGRLLARLAEDGVEPSREQLARVHNPVGLDLGAVGPEEIAVSIVAELIAVRRGRSGVPLRAQPEAA